MQNITERWVLPKGFFITQSSAKVTEEERTEMARKMVERNREFLESDYWKKYNPANWGPPTYGFFVSEEKQPDDECVSIET